MRHADSKTFRLLERHRGVWEGRYTHLDGRSYAVEEVQIFRIRVEVFADSDPTYRQTSHYWWADGREQELVYEGSLRGEQLVIDSERMWGECRAISADTLYMEYGYKATPALRIAEMIQLSEAGEQRARTWHWLRAGQLERITLVREYRVSDDPASWPLRQQRPA
ncbi:MAG: hypothetical protein IPG25_00090 [Proteobacteria bacterium]|nr:hypothetical protein [Pseudomonadota bacterium]